MLNWTCRFQLETRQNRVRFARDAIDNPDVSIAEKFRQVLTAISELKHCIGRTLESYPDSALTLNGQDRDVNILRVGRIALLFQTTDRQITGPLE